MFPHSVYCWFDSGYMFVHTQFIDEDTVDVPVVRQRQVPVIQEVPQVQYIDRITDVTVTRQRLSHRCENRDAESPNAAEAATELAAPLSCKSTS